MPIIDAMQLSMVTSVPNFHPEHDGFVAFPVFGFLIHHPDGPIVVDTGIGQGHALIDALYGHESVRLLASGSKTKTTATTTAGSSSATNTVSKGAGARDATADVSDLRLAEPDAIGFREVMAKITNNSSKRSNYFINVAIESADGKTQIDTATLFVNSLEPGQSTEAKGISTSKDVPADAKLTLKSVTRLAAT